MTQDYHIANSVGQAGLTAGSPESGSSGKQRFRNISIEVEQTQCPKASAGTPVNLRHRAARLIGERNIRRWVTIAAMLDLASDSEVVVGALIRGQFCEPHTRRAGPLRRRRSWGKEIQILYIGRAHTRGDSIVYVPQDRIVYLSELFFASQFLFINDGYGLDWLKALNAVDALGAEIFVPGHDPIPADPKETRQELRRFRQMLVDVRDAVQREVARGATEEQAVATIQWPQYEKMQSYEAQRETAVRRLYQQLTGTLK